MLCKSSRQIQILNAQDLKFRGEMPAQLEDAEQVEPLNVALSVADSTLEWLTHKNEGRLTAGIPQISLCMSWERFQQG